MTSTDGKADALVWVALIHTPGPTATSPMSKDPRFVKHLAFLRSLAQEGWLVAAGSFSDADGEGMTVVRVPHSVGIQEISTLARTDESVTSGLFDVRIRPWNVAMTGELG